MYGCRAEAKGVNSDVEKASEWLSRAACRPSLPSAASTGAWTRSMIVNICCKFLRVCQIDCRTEHSLFLLFLFCQNLTNKKLLLWLSFFGKSYNSGPEKIGVKTCFGKLFDASLLTHFSHRQRNSQNALSRCQICLNWHQYFSINMFSIPFPLY